MSFESVFHEADRILEVVYPPDPTQRDVEEYLTRTRALIDALEGPWSCLVDQRAVGVLPPALVVSLASLNSHAAKKGMLRSARVVSTKASAIQANRLASAGGIEVRTFSDRDSAFVWLRSAS